MRYRRSQAAGGTYFFTVNLRDRRGTLLVDHVDDLRRATRIVRERHPFVIDAWAVLPDHLHAVWTLPEDDSDFPTHWSLIKAGFSRTITAGEPISASRERKGERGIWQRRFWEHQIRDDRDRQAHIDYVHFNPVKHGYVTRASDWPHSTIHRYIRDGIASADWAADPKQVILDQRFDR
ncbi:MAG: transposase [Xanthomonadales bacterium]|nr:transposase [Xanthomonadales bacterium]